MGTSLGGGSLWIARAGGWACAKFNELAGKAGGRVIVEGNITRTLPWNLERRIGIVSAMGFVVSDLLNGIPYY
jgi:hypothetical protein